MKAETKKIIKKRMLFFSIIFLVIGLVAIAIGLIGFQNFLGGEIYEEYKMCEEILPMFSESEDFLPNQEEYSLLLYCIDKKTSLDAANEVNIFGGLGLVIISVIIVIIRAVIKSNHNEVMVK